MKNLYSLLLLFGCIALHAQGENDNWYFGYTAGVSFAGPVPVSQAVASGMNTFEGNAAISDASGQLLFYSNGRKVWNKNHQIMPNGTSLTADGNTDSQGVVIVPYPGHPKQYFVFTTNGGAPYNPNNIHAYSIVDMNLQSGLGDVSSLNNPLNTNFGTPQTGTSYEAITVVKNNSAYWVLIPYLDKLLAYNVDALGVNINPVVSSFDGVVDQNITQIKVSPKGDMLALTQFNSNTCKLFYFDINTGALSNSTPFRIFTSDYADPTGNRIYSAEFSSKSNNIWLSVFGNPSKIFGYDILNVNTPPKIIDPVPYTTYFGTVQLAKDNNIYVARNQSQYLAVIQNPDDLVYSTFTLNYVYLNSHTSGLGLPQKISNTCQWDLLLVAPEVNNQYTYEVSDHITTQNTYKVVSGQDITLSAGNYIDLLPNTDISGVFLAKIEGCGTAGSGERIVSGNPDKKTVTTYLDLSSNAIAVKVYPNPTSGVLNIKASSEVRRVQVYDTVGNLVGTFETGANNNPTIDLSGLSKGVYYLMIESTNKTEYSKVIKD